MSWSLQLKNGDLQLGAASFATVTGSTKLLQDLRCAILERMGTDDLHPGFGSLIDGGRKPDGTEVESLIGSVNWSYVAAQVGAEIRRIARDHQSRQLRRNKEDRYRYGRSTYDPGEVLVSLGRVDFQQVKDAMAVTVTIITGDAPVTVTIPLTTES